jgi:hypothetical protein
MLQHRLCSAQSSAIKKSNKKIETTRQVGPMTLVVILPPASVIA